MSLIKKIEDALCKGESLDALEKKSATDLKKMDGEEDEKRNDSLVQLFWNSLLQCTPKTIKTYFPKRNGFAYALQIERYIEYFKEYWDDPKKVVDSKLSKKEAKEIQEKGAMHQANILACLRCLLSDSTPSIVAFALVALKGFFEKDLSEEFYKKVQLLYLLPSFRGCVSFLCKDTPKFDELALLHNLIADENKECVSAIDNLVKEHRVDERFPSIRDYILSQDTDHKVELPIDYFNNVIFDDRLNRYDYAMEEGFTELLSEEDVVEEEKLAFRQVIDTYLANPTDENLREMNIVSERFIGCPSIQYYMLDVFADRFDDIGMTTVKKIVETEKMIVKMYLQSSSILCVKVAIMLIGRVLTYRPYFMPIYKEFERLSCCEELSSVALEACQHIITIPTDRLQNLYKEFTHFGKILIINYMPKDSVVKRNVIKNFAFRNTAYPGLMAQKLMKTKELKLREMLLGEEPLGFDMFYINEFVEEYLKNDFSVFLHEKDFFRLMRGYLDVHPSYQNYSSSILVRIFDIFFAINKKQAKELEHVWTDYNYKESQRLMEKIKRYVRCL